jgi:hypothetical protein
MISCVYFNINLISDYFGYYHRSDLEQMKGQYTCANARNLLILLVNFRLAHSLEIIFS